MPNVHLREGEKERGQSPWIQPGRGPAVGVPISVHRIYDYEIWNMYGICLMSRYYIYQYESVNRICTLGASLGGWSACSNQALNSTTPAWA